MKGSGAGRHTQTGQFSLKDVVYQDAGTYKCVGQSGAGRKKLELQPTASVAVKGKEQERERKNKTGATFLQFLLYTTRSRAEWVNWFLIVHSKQFLLAVERANKKKERNNPLKLLKQSQTIALRFGSVSKLVRLLNIGYVSFYLLFLPNDSTKPVNSPRNKAIKAHSLAE